MKDNYLFNIWLTGLIEGDGTIVTPDSEKNYPHIQIAFNKKDKTLALRIIAIIGAGTWIEDNSVIRLTWRGKENLLNLIDRINGHMRTPKILRLHKLIDWCNNKYNLCIQKKNLDLSPIGYNPWLSGMSDADSNFNIIITHAKYSYRVQRQWRLEISQLTYFGSEQQAWAQLVSAYLNTNLLSRHRLSSDSTKIYSSWIMVAHSHYSLKLIEDYFNSYPLYSSKFLDYKDWKLCGLITEKNKENYEKVLYLKNGMNNKRTHFNWDHIY